MSVSLSEVDGICKGTHSTRRVDAYSLASLQKQPLAHTYTETMPNKNHWQKENIAL